MIEKNNMYKEYLIFYIHIFIILAIFSMCVFIPVKYIKYIFFIPLLLSSQWVIFSECIINKCHPNLNNELTDIINKLSPNTYKYIKNKYTSNEIVRLNAHFVNFINILMLTFLTFRVIFNINFI